MKMALSVDSAWYRWQPQHWWPVEEIPQTQLESKPLLSSGKERKKYNLDKWRVVFPSNERFQKESEKVSQIYSGNWIRTTKYTLLTFLPQNLFEQFYRLANIYFLFLVIINWFPQLEVFHREITMLPLAVVLLVIAVKDGIEDYKRYRYDQQINFLKAKTYNVRPCCQSVSSDSENEEPVKRRKGRRKKKEAKRVIVSNVPFEGKWKENPNRHYEGNKIKTTKYTFLSFIPKNLFEQFHRFANFYFVAIVALNFIPVLNAFEPGIAAIPVCVIMAITAIKDAWEDFRRFNLDTEINSMGCLVYSRSKNTYTEKCWKDVQVGDFVQLQCNEIIPADILLLYSSDQNGICHLETANLDGETNLKQRQVVKGCFMQNTEFKPECFQNIIVCEKPNNELTRFKGYIIGHETKAMLNNRGPRYKRSKIEQRMNLDIFFCVGLLFLMCLIGALGHGIWNGIFSEHPLYVIPDVQGNYLSPVLAGFYMFLTMIILLQVLIPLSLYISIELVKLGQVFFIHSDIDLYDEEKDVPIQCRALNITEDLGQIQYIFSDKTGTLTENKMVFRRCSIHGKEFSHKENAKRLETYNEVDSDNEEWTKHLSLPSNKGAEKITLTWTNASKPLKRCQSARAHFQGHTRNRSLGAWGSSPSQVAFSSSIVTTPSLMKPSGLSLERIHQLFQRLKLASLSQSFQSTRSSSNLGESFNTESTRVCADSERKDYFPTQSCSTLTDDDSFRRNSATGNDSPEDLDPSLLDVCGGPVNQNVLQPDFCYEAESPDEAALVHAAQAYGFTLVSRTTEQVTVRLPEGTLLTFDLLFTLGFDSNRKRMSVVVRHPLTNEIILYTKGADSVIMDLLEDLTKAKIPDEKSMRKVRNQTQKHLDLYAQEGLRTLCIAKKTDRQTENSYSYRAKSATECDGATGIEDRLQDGVPDTIAAFREAGIQMWVLTGDKQETAVNIAYSCKLLNQRDTVFTINTESKETCESLLDITLEEVKKAHIVPRTTWKFFGIKLPFSSSATATPVPTIGLVVDGTTLNIIFQGKLQHKFLELTKYSRSVLCCRCTPLQKSMVVKLVRSHLKVMTLAIGDGANDVSMIQAADVGIGISGQEGMQAVMASDFAISQFKHLKKLLLVHGHWCYSRLGKMVIYFFYKNVAYVSLLFWYQFYCAFSGTSMIDYWQLIFFNLFFTSVPPIVSGILDKDVPVETLLSLPAIYKSGQNSEVYQDSDIGVFTFGIIVNTVSLLTILFHQALEIPAWVCIYNLFSSDQISFSNKPYFWQPALSFRHILSLQMAYTCHTPGKISIADGLYLILALQGTFKTSPILQTQHLDKLPKEEQVWEIQKWKLKEQGRVVHHDDPDPASANRGVSASGDYAAAAGGHLLSENNGQLEQEKLKEWILNGESNDSITSWNQEETAAASFLSAATSPGQSTPVKPFCGLLPKNTESSARRSHRRHEAHSNN
ncbi:hypothetical protein JD844_011902 [Phrynosoma platyrhinos]|uniref:Phospholipid-transporting ATPase n=1 Tax=Phrynosoma platyrhinos TaxID=52577 RepID=A0ABQ7TKF8_PHRPL|nr:hypothetical protein JD844_011902 [Phrynosoma platyrhinos]